MLFFFSRTCSTLTNGTEKKTKKKKRKQGARSLEALAKPRRSSELLSQVCVCVCARIYICVYVFSGWKLGEYIVVERGGNFGIIGYRTQLAHSHYFEKTNAVISAEITRTCWTEKNFKNVFVVDRN